MSDDVPIKKLSVKALKGFLTESTYRDYLENASSYNTRLLVERRMRLPFLDAQTGIAQNSSSLYFNRRDRMPGDSRVGKLYTYPAERWRKRKRQYYFSFFNVTKSGNGAKPDVVEPARDPEASIAQPSTSGMSEVNEESREATQLEPAKPAEAAWAYYDDELGLYDDDFEVAVEADSDYDYEESSKKKKKKSSRTKESTPKTSKGRKKGYEKNYDVDNEKPFSCELCGVRYKTRPGLAYHYTHIHKDHPQYHPHGGGGMGTGKGDSNHGGDGNPEGSGEDSNQYQFQQAGAAAASGQIDSTDCDQAATGPAANGVGSIDGGDALAGLCHFQDSFLSFLKEPGPPKKKSASGPEDFGSNNGGSSQSADEGSFHSLSSSAAATSGAGAAEQDGAASSKRSGASPYCDFCLGDSVTNKKTSKSEELVSCSDCGRSGHPSCLQFSANMIISVRKYRWQCIECKCCTLCGTSDNDDQLLFCDDCDRGYHMYCLKPPLSSPPEGSWSCDLCVKEFHS